VGAGQAAEGVDALLRRTADGQLFIPGSAIGGALRTLATRLAPRLGGQVCRALLPAEEAQALAQPPATGKPRVACQCAVCQMFGAVDPQETNDAETGGAASRLWVMDARPANAGATTVRDGVGIDRQTGAAARAEALKYNLEVLPAGCAFTLRMELEKPDGLDERLLAACLAEWVAGRAGLGGRVGRGLGAFDLTRLKVERLALDDKATLLKYLKRVDGAGVTLVSDWPRKEKEEVSAWLAAQVAQARQSVVPLAKIREDLRPFVASAFVEVTLALQAEGPFIANSPTRAQMAGVDHAPLIEGRPVLPGASIRGALRSHAERIARTWATNRCADLEGFRAKCPACDPGARTEGTRLQACDALLGKPAELDKREVAPEELCLACRLFGSARWGSRLVVEDAPLAKGTEPVYKAQDFLAIDRFTGGGRDSAKFDAVTLWRPRFSARLRLEHPEPWELGWLALTLRDLAEGWLTLGFGAAKGFGRVTVPEWTVRVGRMREDDLALPPAQPVTGAPSVYDIFVVSGAVDCKGGLGHIQWTAADAAGSGWLAQAGEWVQAWQGALEGFERGGDQRTPLLYPCDTYFGEQDHSGKLLSELYPRSGEALRHVR
jgi:CRISPR/Cas system CSM-associated protein Csm3 (group 7 of RAMP superfamily)